MIFGDLHTETALAVGYGLFLLLVALGVEWFGRLSHRYVRSAKTIGFHYEPAAKAWRCSEGSYLWLDEIDHESKVIRWRAEARRCNGCAIKSLCTDSEEGRELAHSFESWPESEMGRFHRGFSWMLVVLSGFLLTVALARHFHDDVERLTLSAVLVLAVLTGARLWRRFPAPPSDNQLPADLAPLARNWQVRWARFWDEAR